MRNKILFLLVAIVALALTIGSAVAQSTDPQITSTPTTSAVANQEYTYQVQHTPADNGSVQYTLNVAPSGMTISSSGLVSWTPTTAGEYEVDIMVSDDDSSDSQSYSIQVTSTPPTFSASDAELGGDNQKRDEDIVGQVWRVTNTGSETINNIQLTLTGDDADYELTATLPSTSLPGGQSMDILFNAFVPIDQDAGREKIATVQLSGTGVTSFTKSVYLETENNLVIDEIEVEVDGNKDTLNGPGDIDDEADFGDEIEITVKVENTFDENIEIQDITVELDASDLDPADGLDDDLSDLEDGEDDEVTFTFTMDIDDVDADDAPFKITVKVEGEDENGAMHGEEWDIELDMDVNSRDVRIRSVTLSQTILACDETDLRIDYELRNVGTKDTDEVMVKFEIDELDVGLWERDLNIDEGDTEDFTSTLSIPEDSDTGVYFLDMTVYATDSTSDDTDDEVLTFEIRSCSTDDDDNTDDGQTNGGIDAGTGNVPVEVTGVPVASSTGTSDVREASTYLIVLGVLVVVLLIVVIAMGAKLMQKD